jgi:hypothetical protein
VSGELFTSHHLSQNKITEFQRLRRDEGTTKSIQSSRKRERRRRRKRRRRRRRKEKEEKVIQMKRK